MSYYPSGIPQSLKSLKIWALSAPGQTNRHGREFSPKAPMIPVQGRDWVIGIKPTDETTWRDFDEVDAWQDIVGGYPGLMVSSGLIGIDLDLEKASPEYAEWANGPLINSIPSSAHVERSPSGIGLRIIVKGTIPRVRKTKTVEIYDKERFLRMTGNVVERTGSDMDEQAWLDWFYSTLPAALADEEEQIAQISFQMLEGDELQEIYEEMLLSLPPHEQANIAKIDRGEGKGGSDDAFELTIAICRYTEDPNLAYNLFLTNEGMMAYYSDKYAGKDGSAELRRKFKLWFEKALPKARAQNLAEKDLIPLGKAIVERLQAGALAEAQADAEAHRANAEKVEEPSAQRTVDIPPLPDTPVFQTFLNLYRTNVSVNRGGWDQITALFASATVLSACYKTASAATPAIMVPGDSGSGKENPSKFLTDLLRQAQHANLNTPYFDQLSSFSSGEGIRDNVSDEKMLVWMQSETGPLMTSIGQGEPRATSFQEYMPNAVNGTPIVKNARANVSRDKESTTTYNPRLAVCWCFQPHYLPSFLTPDCIAGGLPGRFTFFPPQRRARHLAPEYVVTPLQGASAAIKVAQLCAARARTKHITTLLVEDRDALAYRLHVEFPPMGALEPIHSRLAELVLRWACISYGSRDLQNDVREAVTAYFTKEDLDFGFAMARMSVDVLKTQIGWSSEGGVNVQYYLMYKGLQKALQECGRAGKALTLSRTLQVTPKQIGMGRPKTGTAGIDADRRLLAQICNEMLSLGVLKEGQRRGGQISSYIPTGATLPYVEEQLRILDPASVV